MAEKVYDPTTGYEVRELSGSFAGTKYLVDDSGTWKGNLAPAMAQVATTTLLKTVENLPAGTTFKIGDNPELDEAVSSGQAGGITVGAGGQYLQPDGKPITSAGGTKTVADLSGATDEDMANIAALADLKFLAQNTGVSSALLNDAYKKVGVDPSDNFAFVEAEKILTAAGYKPGEQANFYGNNTAIDAGAKILVDRWAEAPTEQELIDAGLDPETYTTVNNNVASQTYLKEKLAQTGGTSSASFANLNEGQTLQSSNAQTDKLLKARDEKDSADSYWNKRSSNAGGLSYSEMTLDMTEWDLIKKKAKKNKSLFLPITSPGESATARATPLLPAGTVAAGQPVVPQVIPQNITQAVTPPVYNDTGFSATNIGDTRSGTFGKPLQTAGLSAVPLTASYKTHYAGTPGLVDQTLLAPTGGPGSGSQQVRYYNPTTKQELMVTVFNGVAVTYVPPGFVPKPIEQQEVTGAAKGGYMQGYAEGGSTDKMLEAKFRIAEMNGYTGPKTNASLNAYANASPAMTAKFNAIGATMNQGGMVQSFNEGGASFGSSGANSKENGFDPATNMYYFNGVAYNSPEAYSNAVAVANGGTATDTTGSTAADTTGSTATDTTGGTAADTTNADNFKLMQENLINQTMQPMQSTVQSITPTANQFVPVDAGQTLPIAPYAEAATVGTVQQAELPTASPTFASFTPDGVATDVAAETAKLSGATGTVSDAAQAEAEQQLTSSVTGMKAAQGEATMVDAPAAREIEAGEIISGAANAEKAALFTEQIQAATATPSSQATVQGQLEGLMQQFEGGNTPSWAAGSMRAAMATMAARGIGASSMAGQAVIQAAMESALPIAQVDAQTQAQFESQNLSNRQARAMLSAQQRATFLGQEFNQEFQARVQNSARIGDIANMNFTAEQNIAMENARATNTMDLNNLSNSQAMVMAEAAALSNLDMANLNNRQQAAVQNAQAFLGMDMANLNNDQQTSMFKTQQNVQALFTDQAAENASKQFNASSENQTNQFFENLRGQTSQFNASQQNAMDQFNVNSVNALREFNSEIQQQRDMFNAQNGLVIAQSNAQWRQNLDTLNTTALNDSNREFAATMNGLTAGNLEQVWQRERDIMDYAYKISASSKDRALSIMLADKKYEEYAKARGDADETSMWSFLTETVLDITKIKDAVS